MRGGLKMAVATGTLAGSIIIPNGDPNLTQAGWRRGGVPCGCKYVNSKYLRTIVR